MSEDEEKTGGQKLADNIEDALRRVFELIPAPPKTDAVKRDCKSLDIDWRMLDILSVDGFGYTHQRFLAWSLGYEQRVNITLDIQRKLICVVGTCDTGWASGGRLTPGQTAACASLYIEAAHTAARVEVILADALKMPRRYTQTEKHVAELWDAACDEMQRRCAHRAETLQQLCDAKGGDDDGGPLIDESERTFGNDTT